MGRNAFTTFDDSHLTADTKGVDEDLRVIGIFNKDDWSEAKAFSVPKLDGHEIANTRIGSADVAAAY